MSGDVQWPFHVTTPSMTLLSSLRNRHVSPQLVIQFTTFCNATCPQCQMRKGNDVPRRTLDTDYTRRIIEYAANEWRVQSLSFTGGEPGMFLDDVLGLVRYASALGIKFVRTGTNGYMFRETPGRNQGFERRVHQIAEKLAETDLYTFWISIDSIEPGIHEKMRGLRGLTRGIERSLAILKEYELYPAANIGVNRYMDGQIEPQNSSGFDAQRFYEKYLKGFCSAFQRVLDMGFTTANICYPMSAKQDRAVYGATSRKHLVCYSEEEKALLFRALSDALTEYRHRLRIFTPKSSLAELIEQNLQGQGRNRGYPCRGGTDFFFVDANNGHIFPCGFRGSEDLGEIWDVDIQTLRTKEPLCYDCQWECFRDATALLSPLLDLYHSPLSSATKFFHDEKMQTWLNDLRYAESCDFFSSRKPPNFERMAKASRTWLG